MLALLLTVVPSASVHWPVRMSLAPLKSGVVQVARKSRSPVANVVGEGARGRTVGYG